MQRITRTEVIGSALVYAHKIKAAQKATRKDRHSIRAVSAIDSDSDFIKKIEGLRRKSRNLEERKGDRNTKIQCWNYGATRHVLRIYPTSIDGGDNFPPQQGN
ncbi:hypothetical protein NPIL_535311 [Nephila pilipes]|uniref:Uncharacterized protein n=1 Tax=Nephila pilipes TaxID=299642 RepID=A0A8X6PJC9_NEPPI|nr:hypothetical protein NPIL_535311 [Nephila pilipes]